MREKAIPAGVYFNINLVHKDAAPAVLASRKQLAAIAAEKNVVRLRHTLAWVRAFYSSRCRGSEQRTAPRFVTRCEDGRDRLIALAMNDGGRPGLVTKRAYLSFLQLR